MSRNVFISRFLAAFFFGVFMLGITPKKFLHDAIATHTDGTASRNQSDHSCRVQSSTVHCQLENFVAESPFIHDGEEALFKQTAFLHHFIPAAFSLFSPIHFGTSLRGPPAFMKV